MTEGEKESEVNKKEKRLDLIAGGCARRAVNSGLRLGDNQELC